MAKEDDSGHPVCSLEKAQAESLNIYRVRLKPPDQAGGTAAREIIDKT